MADIRLAKPAAGASESVQCAPEARFVFDFPTTDATLARDGDNLTISFEDGSKLQLEGFYQEYNGENLPSFNIDGTEVAAADFFAAMNEPDLMPAAGPGTGTVANGARFHEWGGASLTSGITHLDGLDWNFSRAFEWDDVPNAVGRNGDDWGWGGTSGSDSGNGTGADAGPADNPVSLIPENPVPVPPGTEIPGGGEPGNQGIVPPGDVRVVSEAGLRDADTVSVNGAMRIAAPDGLASIEIGGRVIWQNGHMVGDPQFATDEGYFHNFAYDAASGRLTYTYTLTGATQEHSQPGADHIAHTLPVTVRDVDGDAASSSIMIVIRDDVAESNADTNTLTEGEETFVTGNLLTGERSDNPDDLSGKDEAGADGWMAGSLTLTDAAGNAVGMTLEGKYGTLTIEADGSYTYTLKSEYKLTEDGKEKSNLPEDVEDEVFHYQVKDADGDVTSNTLTIDLVNTPFEPTKPTEPGDSELKANSIEFTLTDSAAAGDDKASQDKSADLFDGPHDVKSAVFGNLEDMDIKVEGAAGEFDWSVSEDGKTLTGTGANTVLTVTITGVNADGTVAMTATMTDPAGHAVESDSITISGIAVTGEDVAGNTATNANVSITIADATPESKADANTLTEGEQTFVTGNLLTGERSDNPDDLSGKDEAGADGWLAGSLTLTDAAGNAVGMTLEGKYGTLTIEADGSYSYTLKPEYKLTEDGKEKSNLPDDVEDEVFHYQVKDADGDVTESTLTIDLVNKPFEPTKPTEPGDSELKANSIEFTLTDAAATGDAKASQDKAADLFDGPHDVKSAVFGILEEMDIKVDGAAGEFDWSVSEDGKTLTGTGAGTVLTVTITGVNTDGTVAMTATMTDPAGHAVKSDSITISGIAVTGEDVAGNTATNANVSITIEDATPESKADTNTLTEGEQTFVTGNLLTGERSDNPDDLSGKDEAGADGWMAGSLTLTDAAGNAQGMTVEGKYGTLTIEADGSYTYTLKPEYKYTQDGEEKANLPDDVEDEVFHYQVKDADGDVTESTLTIDLVNKPFEPTKPTEPGDSELKANSIEFTLTDSAAAGDDKASQDKAADLFDGPHDVKSAVFGNLEDMDIKVEGAAGEFDWSVSEDGKTLTGTGAGTVLTVTITGVNPDGTVAMTATMTDPAGHAVNSNSISITGIAVTGEDVLGATATNANVSITIVDATPESKADTNTLTEGEETFVTGNLLTGERSDNPDDLSGKDEAGADGWLTGSLTLTDAAGNAQGMTVEGKYGTLTIEADGSYTYTLKPEYKYTQDGEEKANLPEDVEDEIFHYQVKDADGDVTESTLTIDLVNKPFEPTESGSDNLEGKSITFEFSDADAAGDAVASQPQSADLFDGPHDVKSALFGSTDGIEVKGAAGEFDWEVSEDGKTLTGTGAGTLLTVTITGVNPDGTVAMTATMTDPAGHAMKSDSISITGIAVTGEDVAGNTATNANVSITIEDAAPQAPEVTDPSSGLSYENYASASFVGDFSANIPDGAYAKPSTTLNDAYGANYWESVNQLKGGDGYYTGKGANDQAHGNYDAYVDGIYFCPTMAKYSLAADGSLLSVEDYVNKLNEYRDKNFYLTNKGLTVGGSKQSLNNSYQGDKYVWNEDEVGFANSGSAGYSEAIMIEQPKNAVAYGVTIDLGSIEVGDRILLSFFLTPQNNDDNNLVKTVILEPTADQIKNGTFSTTLQLPDGFTKLMVSALPSTDGKHNSGFTLQGVAFGKPVYGTSGAVDDVDYGADGAAAAGALAWSFDAALNGWKELPPDSDGAEMYYTEVQVEGGLGKGDYLVEISILNGVMRGILRQSGDANGLEGRPLFEGHFNAATGTWELNQYYNFVFANGHKEIIATLTATDADGDSASTQVNIALTDTPLERFDNVSTGYYDQAWLSDASKDTATDFMAGGNLNDLIYSKGGDDIISGDGGSAALTAVGTALGLDSTTQNAIVNNVNKPQAPNSSMTANAGKVYAAIGEDAEGFAKKLDALEDQHKDWAGNDAIYGGAGKDVLLGWGGNDYLEGDAGRDFLFAGNGDDIIVYDAADAYIDGGRGFDILLANKGTGNLGTLANVHRINMLIRSEREDDVKSLSINTLASLEQYGITITAAGAVVLVGENNWYWSTAKGAWVYSDGDGPLLSLEVADGVPLSQAARAAGEAVGPADDASAQALSGEDTVNDSPLDTAGDSSPLFAMQKEAGMGEDEAQTASTSPAASAASAAAAAGKSVIQGDEDEPNTLFGTDGDDVLIGGSASDFIDGGAGSDTIYAGAGDDLIVYDPTDYLIDGGAGIDFLLSDGQGTQYTLAEMLENYRDQTDADKPMVNDVEVMIKGVDTTGLQNMDALAAKYGFSLGKDANGRDVLILGDQWKEVEGSANGVTTTYENGDGVTLETTLQSATESDLGEQAAQNIVLSSNS